ncbi:hypothetical protein STEG23_021926, partial [Scotinomys teguina]
IKDLQRVNLQHTLISTILPERTTSLIQESQREGEGTRKKKDVLPQAVPCTERKDRFYLS